MTLQFVHEKHERHEKRVNMLSCITISPLADDPQLRIYLIFFVLFVDNITS
jgi:hypothetical protein